MAQAILEKNSIPCAEYDVKINDRLAISAKKTNGDCFITIHKDKVKLSLSLEEYALLNQQKDTIDLACFLLKGQLGVEPCPPRDTTGGNYENFGNSYNTRN